MELLELSEAVERLEPLFHVNDLNGAKQWNRWNIWNVWNRPQYYLAIGTFGTGSVQIEPGTLKAVIRLTS